MSTEDSSEQPDHEQLSLLKSDGKGQSTFTLDGKTYLITRKRWGILILVCAVLLLDVFSSAFFAFINDLTSEYFRTKPAVTDLLSTINLVSRGSFSVVIVLASNYLNFRRLTLLASATVFTGSLMIAVGVSSRDSFAIVMIGQLINGCGTTTAITLAQMVATNWFPSKEKGIAVAMSFLTRRVSTVAATLVATYGGGSLASHSEEAGRNSSDAGLEAFEKVYTPTYLTLAAIAFVNYVAVQVFLTDHPPQLNKGEGATSMLEHAIEGPSVISQLRESLSLLKNKVFLVTLSIFALILANRPLTDVLLSSFVLEAFPYLNDQYVGVMYCVGLAVGAIGGPFAGTILDRYKKPEYKLPPGIGMMVGSCAMYCVAINVDNTAALYVSNILMALGRDYSFVCVQHALVAAMYHETKSTRVKAFSFSGSLPWMLTSAYASLIRAMMNVIGTSAAVLTPIPFNLLGILIWVFTWKYFYGSPTTDTE